ncbi:hypothetical protein V6N13_001097 [Hibiscus sabdariffa]|uniref:Uncharacterized protein n=1 Tax=Hibiscus sabdariffa TaxID=183260 RepID=A0ABR2G7N3_9ROSI
MLPKLEEGWNDSRICVMMNSGRFRRGVLQVMDGGMGLDGGGIGNGVLTTVLIGNKGAQWWGLLTASDGRGASLVLGFGAVEVMPDGGGKEEVGQWKQRRDNGR